MANEVRTQPQVSPLVPGANWGEILKMVSLRIQVPVQSPPEWDDRMDICDPCEDHLDAALPPVVSGSAPPAQARWSLRPRPQLLFRRRSSSSASEGIRRLALRCRRLGHRHPVSASAPEGSSAPAFGSGAAGPLAMARARPRPTLRTHVGARGRRLLGARGKAEGQHSGENAPGSRR